MISNEVLLSAMDKYLVKPPPASKQVVVDLHTVDVAMGMASLLSSSLSLMAAGWRSVVQEWRNFMIAKMFGALSLAQSGRLSSLSSAQLTPLVANIAQFAQEHKSLKEIGCQTLCRIIHAVCLGVLLRCLRLCCLGIQMTALFFSFLSAVPPVIFSRVGRPGSFAAGQRQAHRLFARAAFNCCGTVRLLQGVYLQCAIVLLLRPLLAFLLARSPTLENVCVFVPTVGRYVSVLCCRSLSCAV